MAHPRLSWLRQRLGRKRPRATVIESQRIPCGECGYWGLVDAMMRDAGTPAQ